MIEFRRGKFAQYLYNRLFPGFKYNLHIIDLHLSGRWKIKYPSKWTVFSYAIPENEMEVDMAAVNGRWSW